MIKKILKEISIPVEVAGGLRNESLVLDVIKISNRIVLGTLAFKDKELLKKLLLSLGPEKIVISVDHMDDEIVIHGWQDKTGIKPIDAIKEFLEMGFTEFLLTNVSKDGTMEGPDLEFLEQACNLEKTNVIASGGISNIEDVSNVKKKNAFGVILGKALYEIKKQLSYPGTHHENPLYQIFDQLFYGPELYQKLFNNSSTFSITSKMKLV